MKKFLKSIVALFVTVSLAVGLCACDFFGGDSGSGGSQGGQQGVSYGTATVNYYYDYSVGGYYWRERYSIQSGKSYEITDLYTPPMRAGYRFLGWTTEYGGEGDLIGTPFSIVGAGFGGTVYNLYAKYEEIPFEVVYHLDGGENHPDNPTSLSGKQKLQKPTKEKHNFIGWYREPDFQHYTDYASMTDDKTTTVDLYAKWQRVYEISYRSNQEGVKVVGDKSYWYHTSFTEDDQEFTVKLEPEYFEGYLFLGWETEEGGELVQNAEIPIDPKEDKRDYAFTAHYERATRGADIRIHISYGNYNIYVREGVSRIVVEDMYKSSYQKIMLDSVNVYYSGEEAPEVIHREGVRVYCERNPEAVENEF